MSEQTNNLKLWDLVGKTNPKYTKKVTTRGGFTSINPYYQIEMATRVWGVFGSSWGVRHIEKDFSLMESTGLMLYKAEFFCPDTSFEINNAIAVKSVGKGYVDEDFMKKVETDTLTKALSKIGFNNDIFKAEFDNADYVAERKAEVAMEESENKERLSEERFIEVKGIVESGIASFVALPTTVTVDNMRKKTLANVQRKLSAYKFNPALFNDKINHAAEARIEALRAQQNNQ